MDLTNKGIKIGNICINILLYADDLVLLSETEEDLQCMLTILDKWWASRALGKVLAKYYKNKGLGYKTYTKLYESCVCPIMDYCASVWGYAAKNDKIIKIHTRAMHCFLGVNKYSWNRG